MFINVVNGLISSIAMHSGMSVHISIALMPTFISIISSSLFIVWLCMDSQPAMNSCGPRL